MNTVYFSGNIGGPKIVTIALIELLIFGVKIPELIK